MATTISKHIDKLSKKQLFLEALAVQEERDQALETNQRQSAAINGYVATYNEQVVKITELQVELTTALERIAIQDQEIADLKEASKRYKTMAAEAGDLFNQALQQRDEAHRALVLQIRATHEKSYTQKPS